MTTNPINVHGQLGVTYTETLTMSDDELDRRDIMLDGVYIGQVVYRKRPRKGGGTSYGWQPAKAAKQSRFLTFGDAVAILVEQHKAFWPEPWPTRTAPSVRDPVASLTITVSEAARALGISRESAYRAVRAGQIPAVRLGRRWVVPSSGVRRLLGIDGDDAL
jgi:excisionase family DNA binding protein